MAKESAKNYNTALLQPDELKALKALVKEFIERVQNVDNEIETLKEDRKTIIEEYQDKLDLKTLQAALKVLKIQQGVQHRDTYDLFMSTLTDPAQ
jgi:uncharacterized protein (UPF0335 family)